MYQDDFDKLGLEMDLSDSSILRHKDLFNRSMDTYTKNVDEMFDNLKIRSEDGIYYLRYDCPWVI